jgi:catechol 2,3-dioxygenase-like lactoylglutathione lyase family enzyme
MPTLKSVCIVTGDIQRLRDFYRTVLRIEPEGDDPFVFFPAGNAGLCLFTAGGMEEMAPGSTRGAGAGNCVLEFEVDDVDHECERLRQLAVPIVKPPTTQPWGLRSVWFRDPDGNIVNYYARVAPEE